MQTHEQIDKCHMVMSSAATGPAALCAMHRSGRRFKHLMQLPLQRRNPRQATDNPSFLNIRQRVILPGNGIDDLLPTQTA